MSNDLLPFRKICFVDLDLSILHVSRKLEILLIAADLSLNCTALSMVNVRGKCLNNNKFAQFAHLVNTVYATTSQNETLAVCESHACPVLCLFQLCHIIPMRICAVYKNYNSTQNNFVVIALFQTWILFTT